MNKGLDLIHPQHNQSIARLIVDSYDNVIDIEIHAETMKAILSFSGMAIPVTDRKDIYQSHLYLKDKENDPKYFAKLFKEYFYDQSLKYQGFVWKDDQGSIWKGTVDALSLTQKLNLLKI